MKTKIMAIVAAAVVLGSLSDVSAKQGTTRYEAIEKCVAQAQRAWPHVGIRGNHRRRNAVFRRCMARAGF